MMKKFVFKVLCITCIGMYSCQNESRVEMLQNPLEVKSSVQLSDGILKFSSHQAMNDTISMLLQLSDEDKIEWCTKKGFRSLDMLYGEALDELEDIQHSNTHVEYKSRYYLFREKYSPYLLFNNIDTSDLSPYLATNVTAKALVANINGCISVNDSIININEVKTFTDLVYGKIEQAVLTSPTTKASDPIFEENINSLYIKNGSRKMWAEVEFSGQNVYIKYSAHKKGVFGGWNKYRTEYPTRYLDHSLDTWMLGDYFKELLAVTPEYVNKGELKSGTKMYLGTVLFGDYRPKATAAFEIYSRGTGGDYPGLLEIEFN